MATTLGPSLLVFTNNTNTISNASLPLTLLLHTLPLSLVVVVVIAVVINALLVIVVAVAAQHNPPPSSP